MNLGRHREEVLDARGCASRRKIFVIISARRTLMERYSALHIIHTTGKSSEIYLFITSYFQLVTSSFNTARWESRVAFRLFGFSASCSSTDSKSRRAVIYTMHGGPRASRCLSHVVDFIALKPRLGGAAVARRIVISITSDNCETRLRPVFAKRHNANNSNISLLSLSLSLSPFRRSFFALTAFFYLASV
jgi:hypothetical protein